MMLLQFDERISSALSFVQKLQMDFNTEYVRCPYLATIEIEKQRRLMGKADDGKLLAALLNYFDRFVLKPLLLFFEHLIRSRFHTDGPYKVQELHLVQ